MADRYTGPAVVKRLSDEGASVIGDTGRYLDPAEPDAVVANAGRVDALVVNLIARVEPNLAVETIDDDWLAMFDRLVHPTMRFIRAVLPQMIEREAGKIIVVSSAAPLRVMAKSSSYTTARAAQNAYVRSVGAEVARSNVQINAIAQAYVFERLHRRPSRTLRRRLGDQQLTDDQPALFAALRAKLCFRREPLLEGLGKMDRPQAQREDHDGVELRPDEFGDAQGAHHQTCQRQHRSIQYDLEGAPRERSVQQHHDREQEDREVGWQAGVGGGRLGQPVDVEIGESQCRGTREKERTGHKCCVKVSIGQKHDTKCNSRAHDIRERVEVGPDCLVIGVAALESLGHRPVYAIEDEGSHETDSCGRKPPADREGDREHAAKQASEREKVGRVAHAVENWRICWGGR
ncbi:MAG: NAD(P)-dependent dehydrogenase (short-subunit alcohol dehydrogenase family) [Acidimicrobiales bacterium]|jgi:NAD(P)-dependent dehydrogenase (short-subunit alcohol dehydrogenase family)